MCTAATYQTADFYFGRTLDYEFSYGDEVVILPRNYPLTFRHAETPATRYAMIGMAHVADGYPLYYDACNEKGLCMAGLNFVGNAAYAAAEPGHVNVAQFELIPWVLRQCATVAEARQLLEGTNLVGTPFAAQFPAAQLHWLIADRSGALTLESMADGMHIWENPVGVLTNNPPFPVQLLLLNNYMGVTAQAPENRFSDRIALKPYSRGMGGMGLPGDLSSASRFVRVAFTKLNAVSGTGESESVNQFFHILGSVEQVRGCCAVGDRYEITQYTSCCNATRGIYYYTSYENSQITAVDLHRTDLFAPTLFRYPRHPEWNVRWEN